MRKPAATVTINLTYDAWKDMDSALLERAVQAKDHAAMRDRLNNLRHAIEAQVLEQKPSWSRR